MFSMLGVVKATASFVVSIGATKIVGQVIKNNIAAPETLIEKVTVTAAAWVIGGVVAKAAKNYTDEIIDDAVEGVNTVVNKFKLDAKLGRIARGESTFSDEGLTEANFVKNENGKWIENPVTTA